MITSRAWSGISVINSCIWSDTPQDSSGPSPPCPDRDHPKITTTADEPTVIGTPPPCDTCSTACSASSTTACRPTKPTTRSKPSANPQRPPTKQQLDFLTRSDPYRDTPTRSGGSKHHPKPTVDRSVPRHSRQLHSGSDHGRDGTPAILTLGSRPGVVHADPHSCTERRRRSGMLKLMRRIRRVRPVLPPPSAFTGFRFPER